MYYNRHQLDFEIKDIEGTLEPAVSLMIEEFFSSTFLSDDLLIHKDTVS